jgi:hypothetical protein
MAIIRPTFLYDILFYITCKKYLTKIKKMNTLIYDLCTHCQHKCTIIRLLHYLIISDFHLVPRIGKCGALSSCPLFTFMA